MFCGKAKHSPIQSVTLSLPGAFRILLVQVVLAILLLAQDSVHTVVRLLWWKSENQRLREDRRNAKCTAFLCWLRKQVEQMQFVEA